MRLGWHSNHSLDYGVTSRSRFFFGILFVLFVIHGDRPMKRPYSETFTDQEKTQHEAKIQEYFVRAQAHRTRRLSLPPIPEFPDQSALHAQENQAETVPQEEITGWLPLGTLGLAEIGRALGKKPSPEKS